MFNNLLGGSHSDLCIDGVHLVPSDGPVLFITAAPSICRHTASSQPSGQSTERSPQIVTTHLLFLRDQQFISSCRTNTPSKNCKDRCICLFISVGLISLVLHLKYVIPISSSTLDPSCFPRSFWAPFGIGSYMVFW